MCFSHNRLIGCLAVSYSRMANATLPSALQRFTSEFGMGSGGSTALLPPGKNLQSEKADLVIRSRYLLQAFEHFLGVVWLSLTGN